jgi:hypothetical protein
MKQISKLGLHIYKTIRKHDKTSYIDDNLIHEDVGDSTWMTMGVAHSYERCAYITLSQVASQCGYGALTFSRVNHVGGSDVKNE